MIAGRIKWMLGGVGVVAILGMAVRYEFIVARPATYFDYFVGDIAFLPLQVIIVSVIIERLLHEREKRAMLKKLNMVIGAFFSEAGNDLLRMLTPLCPEIAAIEKVITPAPRWDERDFAAAVQAAQGLKCAPRPDREQLEEMRAFLVGRRTFILALLQNANLLEHESFTDLLWAVTHLTEELVARDDLASLPASDLAHLGGDLDRAHRLLVREWLAYMSHLRTDYPYIYSLSLRTCPLAPRASAVVRE